jgi:hypothetical protein
VKSYRNPLVDKEFLKRLDGVTEREIFARVIALSFSEAPIETVEGRVTTGSINIDGASAVRRTCSLSLVAQNMDINDFYWGLNQKFKLEVGMRNTIDDTYPDIIWFPQGVYVITSFSTSQNTNGFTINISGKDKMCLLNGDVGGNIPSTTDFGLIEIVNDDGTITYEYNSIKTILTELLHTYALEPYHNIILNDIEDSGLELLEYRGDTPIYLFYNETTGIYVQATTQDTMACYYESKEGGWKPGTIGSSVITYRPRVDLASEISS